MAARPPEPEVVTPPVVVDAEPVLARRCEAEALDLPGVADRDASGLQRERSVGNAKVGPRHLHRPRAAVDHRPRPHVDGRLDDAWIGQARTEVRADGRAADSLRREHPGGRDSPEPPRSRRRVAPAKRRMHCLHLRHGGPPGSKRDVSLSSSAATSRAGRLSRNFGHGRRSRHVREAIARAHEAESPACRSEAPYGRPLNLGALRHLHVGVGSFGGPAGTRRSSRDRGREVPAEAGVCRGDARERDLHRLRDGEAGVLEAPRGWNERVVGLATVLRKE